MLSPPAVYAPLAPGYPSAVAAMRAGYGAIEHLLADANPANQGLAVSLPTLVVGGGYLGDCAPAASNYRWFFKAAGSERPSTLSLPTPSSSPLSPPAVYAPLAPGYPSAVAAMRAGNSAIEHLLADANPANQGLAVSLPTLVVGGGYPGDCAPAASNYRWFFKEAGNPSWEVVLRDAGHFQFLDSPPVLQAAVCGLGPARDEDVRRATRACIAAWGHATVPRQRGKTVGGGGRGAVPQQGGGDGGVGGEEEGCISIGGRCGGSGSGGTSGTSDDMDAAAADSWRAGAGREKGPAQAPAQAPAPALTPLTPLTAGENLEAPVSDRKDELEAMMVSVAAELAAEIGEDKLIRSEDLRSAVADAVDRAYEKAVREAVQQRTELEEGVREAEQQLYDLLGPDAECLVAPHALPLQERLDVNLSHLHQLESVSALIQQTHALHLVTLTPRALPLLASSPTHPTASAPFRVPPLPLFSLFLSTFPHFPPIFLPPSSHFSPSFLPYPSGEPREEGKEWLGGLVVLAKLRQRLICLRSSLHLSFEISPNPFLFPPFVPLHSAAKGGGQGVAGGPGGSGEAEEETHLPALLAQRQEGKGWLGGLVVLAELRSRLICLRSSLHLPFESLKSPSSFPLSSHIPPVQQRQEGKGWLGGLVVLAELRSRLISLRSSLHLPFESLKSPSSFPLSSHIPPVQQRQEGKGWLGGLVVLAELRSRLICLRSSLHLPFESLKSPSSFPLSSHIPPVQQRQEGKGWLGGLVVLAELRSRLISLRSSLHLPPPESDADTQDVPSPRPHSPPSFRHPLSPSVRPLTHSSTSLLSSSRSASNLLRSTTPPHTPRSQRSNRSNRDGVSDRGTGWLRSSGAGAGAATATTVAARSAAITVAAKPAPSAALVTRSLSSPSASMSLADVVSLTHHSSNEDGSLSVGAGVGGNVISHPPSLKLSLLYGGLSSAYFQQIEADVVKHADAIWQAKADLEAFQTTDFEELVAFRAKIESLLQDLTDETQVLQRFEGFPSSKLELLRASASLHSRLSALSRDLLSAVPMSNNDRGGTPGAGGGAAGTAGAAAPASVAAVGVCLDRCERLFDRVRREVEAVERSREEDAKKFAAQRLPYSGGAIERVKAAAVRLSSRLLELSAQESMKLRASVEPVDGRIPVASVELVDGRIPVYDVPRVKAGLFLLWRCFQFAFRAYNFAGGQDETAEELALIVAKEMEAYPAYMWG
ncbi:unnamed protein product [Closterium sp. Naga37s-1]|nr:unnamed protein product [Closterium sp. Naga37s-1]